MTDLTREDLDVLVEAVEAWESSGALGEFMGEMISAISGPKDGPEREEWQRRRDAEKAAAVAAKAAEKRARKERSILLRAKLISLRDRADIDAFAESARQ